ILHRGYEHICFFILRFPRQPNRPFDPPKTVGQAQPGRYQSAALIYKLKLFCHGTQRERETRFKVERQPMSALTPKADMCGANSNVRFGPKADIPSFANLKK